MPDPAKGWLRGFPPIVGERPRLLVLGSMPSAESLRRQQYYGHPRNAFWPIMGQLFGAGPELKYEERAARLAEAGVAVWDVIAGCVRESSADADIRSEEPNDFLSFFAAYDSIAWLFFNGAKSEQVFRRRVLPLLQVGAAPQHFLRLPSTSPAHASLSFAAKLEAWRVLERAAAPGSR
ncbi:MAG: DNA-deoxyinosine glycosylase [Planctomycetota bacterium]|nr:MAG: DNA-deoxyinosine glycosylase [Planctomycetota bacterium]